LDFNNLHIAWLGHVGSQAEYWKHFSTMEVERPPKGLKASTLARWRREAPDARFIVPAFPELGMSGFVGPEAEAAWQRTLEDVDALQAEVVVVRTLASFRPTQQNRDALQGFFAAHGRKDLKIAWWAEGLWEVLDEDHQAFCEAAGVIPAIDPLALEAEELPPPGSPFFWRLMGRRGLDARFTDHDLDTLLDLCADREEGYVVFTAAGMLRDARRFVSLARMEYAGED